MMLLLGYRGTYDGGIHRAQKDPNRVGTEDKDFLEKLDWKVEYSVLGIGPGRSSQTTLTIERR
jgi:hypothetical protein